MRGRIGKPHEGGCVELFILFVLCASAYVVPIWCPGAWVMMLGFMQSPLGSTIMLGFIGGVVLIKIKTLGWDRDRPFNDGDDKTPDPYLYDSGDGSGPHLRAFMPEVKGYSFWFQPLSWLFRPKLRKIAILLSNGLVSFTWFPTSHLAKVSEVGKRIAVPAKYKVSVEVGEVICSRKKNIQRSTGMLARTDAQNDFMLFCGLIGCLESSIGVHLPKKLAIVEIDRIEVLENRANCNDDEQAERRVIYRSDMSSINGELKGIGDRLSILEGQSRVYEIEAEVLEQKRLDPNVRQRGTKKKSGAKR